MLKDVLKSIMNDLNRISKIDKNELFEEKVNKIINISYNRYCKSLKTNYDYLLYRDTLKVLKNIKREKAKKEKQNEV